MEVSGVPHQARLMERGVRLAALAAFAFYLLWNAAWIALGRIPPSILRALTGLPCPTTGGLRSLGALLRGEWLQAPLWNPFTLIYIALFGYSTAVLAGQMLRRQRLVLRPVAGWLWGAALALGWAAKFVLGPKYW